MSRQIYKVNTATNFSIGAEEFYLKPGDEVRLPDHELIASMVTYKHLIPVSAPSGPEYNEPETN
jgi:hypothetical protein